MSEPVRSGSAWEYVSDVQVGFVGVDGVGRLGSLARCWDEPFERAAPVRRFIAFEGQKNFTGEYWAASSRDLVGYESWVERDAAMALDFDPAVVALASQPFCLSWWDGDRDRQHTPDYFARLADGTGVVVDVRPEGLVDEEAAEVFAFTAEVCATPSRRPRRGSRRRRAGPGRRHHRRTGAMRVTTTVPDARTAPALAARHRSTDAALGRVRDAITRLRREKTQISVAAVARRANVSRTFLYDHPDARAAVATAMAEAGERRSQMVTDQDEAREATWRQRALNAEDALKAAHAEILTQRTRIGELLGQVRDLEAEWTQEAIQRITAENTTLKQRVRQLTTDNRSFDERLKAARSNLRFQDRRVADLEARLTEEPSNDHADRQDRLP